MLNYYNMQINHNAILTGSFQSMPIIIVWLCRTVLYVIEAFVQKLGENK